ncbi:MAG: hypothetical protein JOY97_00235 [Hyphomicrobiales bacterium]|nr:hypothetical protein [Hyphomicrobiales bacterium]
MPIFPLHSTTGGRMARLVASPLLASTCVRALLLGAAPAQAGQNITTPQASVTNPAEQSASGD